MDGRLDRFAAAASAAQAPPGAPFTASAANPQPRPSVFRRFFKRI